mgnify:CR=1 FL=1
MRSISYHPSGDYLLAGTDHEIIRLYDLQSSTCYIPGASSDNHRGPINKVAFDTSGLLYTSCSRDGSIKLWDAVTNQCIMTIAAAHSGSEVFSVALSRSSRYILSRGKDDAVKLWDCGNGKLVRRYDGAHSQVRAPAVFSNAEDYILAGDDATSAISIWDTRASAQLGRCQGHDRPVKAIAACPTRNVFASGRCALQLYMRRQTNRPFVAWTTLCVSGPLQAYRR